jgi:hypothetical protein
MCFRENSIMLIEAHYFNGTPPRIQHMSLLGLELPSRCSELGDDQIFLPIWMVGSNGGQCAEIVDKSVEIS